MISSQGKHLHFTVIIAIKETRFSTGSDSLKSRKKMSEFIHKFKLPPLTNEIIITDIICKIPKQNENRKKKKRNDCITEENRHCKKKKQGKFRGILKYDVTETNMLCDGDVMAKHKKSKSIGAIQNLLPKQSFLHGLGGTTMDNTNKNSFLPKPLKS